jgi:hypothetical protein
MTETVNYKLVQAENNLQAAKLLDATKEDLSLKVTKYINDMMQPAAIARRLMSDYCGVRIPNVTITEKIASRVSEVLVTAPKLVAPSSDAGLTINHKHQNVNADIQALRDFIQNDLEERKAQYRLIIAMLPKTQNDLAATVVNRLDAAAENMIDKIEVKIEEMSHAGETVYTATDISKLIGISAPLVGTVARDIGYRGNSNYSRVDQYRYKGRAFPRETIVYKEVAIEGIRKEAIRRGYIQK